MDEIEAMENNDMDVDASVSSQKENGKIDFLWKVIHRFDFLTGTTNAKSGLIIAFNAFVFSAIILKWEQVLPAFDRYHFWGAASCAVLLVIAAICSLSSLVYIFLVINPFLKSPKTPGTYHSLIFFGHIQERGTPEKYIADVLQADAPYILEDLGKQAHILACGLTRKFIFIRKAIFPIVFIQIPCFILILMVKLWVSLFGIF